MQEAINSKGIWQTIELPNGNTLNILNDSSMEIEFAAVALAPVDRGGAAEIEYTGRAESVDAKLRRESAALKARLDAAKDRVANLVPGDAGKEEAWADYERLKGAWTAAVETQKVWATNLRDAKFRADAGLDPIEYQGINEHEREILRQARLTTQAQKVAGIQGTDAIGTLKAKIAAAPQKIEYAENEIYDVLEPRLERIVDQMAAETKAKNEPALEVLRKRHRETTGRRNILIASLKNQKQTLEDMWAKLAALEKGEKAEQKPAKRLTKVPVEKKKTPTKTMAAMKNDRERREIRATKEK